MIAVTLPVWAWGVVFVVGGVVWVFVKLGERNTAKPPEPKDHTTGSSDVWKKGRPVSEADSLPSVGDLDLVGIEYPDQYAAASACLRALSTEPSHPARWLEELCKRIANGSPPDAAASRIPLDWNGPLPDPASPLAGAVSPADPEAAGDFALVARDFPHAYDKARAVMAGLDRHPADPESWLRELCRRIDAGSPPEAAALRIPLDLSER